MSLTQRSLAQPPLARLALTSGLGCVVFKVGSALLVDREHQALNRDWLKSLASDIAHLRAMGTMVIVVSSGAVALGTRLLKQEGAPVTLAARQAAAAVGQVALANAWAEALTPYDLSSAQILLSPEDTEVRRRHLNARATMSELLRLGVVPIVNENDTVATAELRFGDNDRLAARVAAMMSVDLLILLSDINGLYSADPRLDATATHIAQVEALTPEVMAMGGPPHEDYASGGMATKLEAARIATEAGCHMLICDGRAERPLMRLESGERATLFRANQDPQTARERWIAGALAPKGIAQIDEGAIAATRAGRSLLPVGVLNISGLFARGDLIQVQSAEGVVIGHGLSNYDCAEALKVCGRRSDDITRTLGPRLHNELIHADNLVMRRALD